MESRWSKNIKNNKMKIAPKSELFQNGELGFSGVADIENIFRIMI